MATDPVNWRQLLFSFSGRINRARFWIGTILLVVAWIAAWTLFSWMFMRAGSLIPVYGFGIAAGVIILWAQLGICIKRLHDRGKSGGWLLIFWALPMAVSHFGQGFTEYSLRIAAAAVIGVIGLWSLIEFRLPAWRQGPKQLRAGSAARCLKQLPFDQVCRRHASPQDDLRFAGRQANPDIQPILPLEQAQLPGFTS